MKPKVGDKFIGKATSPYWTDDHYTVLYTKGSKVVLGLHYNNTMITTDIYSKLFRSLQLDIQTQFNNELEDLLK